MLNLGRNIALGGAIAFVAIIMMHSTATWHVIAYFIWVLAVLAVIVVQLVKLVLVVAFGLLALYQSTLVIENLVLRRWHKIKKPALLASGSACLAIATLFLAYGLSMGILQVTNLII